MTDRTEEFTDLYGEAAYEHIWRTACGDGVFPDVTIHERVTHNACNHTYYGSIEIAGETIHFEHYSGDWNGDGLASFGAVEIVPERSRTEHFFTPANPGVTEAQQALVAMKFAAMSSQPDFQQMQRGMNYDYYFAPGVKSQRHYGAWAAKRGLTISQRTIDG